MTVRISLDILSQVHAHGQASYPEEGAGLLLGNLGGQEKHVTMIMAFENSREQAARHNRYLLTAEDYLRGELQAAQLGLDVLGVFHSHPDHPNLPSEFDREWALPFLSYIITSVYSGQAIESRCWLLNEERTQFVEEELVITPEQALIT